MVKNMKIGLKSDYIFPFGQALHQVVQTDTTHKKAFVLGVYASAVHARWINKDGKQLIAALAVASEPEIFWTGHDAQQQIDKIQIPADAGKLVPAAKNLNGHRIKQCKVEAEKWMKGSLREVLGD